MTISSLLEQFTNITTLIPVIGPIDIVEILIIAYAAYRVLLWIQSSRAWHLMKGFLVLLVIYIAASFLQMTTIVWVIDKTLNIGLLALIVIFQPELRKALEQLGARNMLSGVPLFANWRGKEGEFDARVINELVDACQSMAKVKTGALIVIERNSSLNEYEKTGIQVDGLVTRQLLINIFEHNTPLHDGAVIIRGNRVTSATCYLPLSDNMAISKDLGTRHRAGVGISEVTDSLTIIVSEETGNISAAFEGNLKRRLSAEDLRKELTLRMIGKEDTAKKQIGKGRRRHEK